MPDNSFTLTIAQSPFVIQQAGQTDQLQITFYTNGFILATSAAGPSGAQILVQDNSLSLQGGPSGCVNIPVPVGNGTIGLTYWNIAADGTFQDTQGNASKIFDQSHYHYDGLGNKVLGAQVGAISSPTLTAPSANEPALLNAINAVLAALRGSTGHGIIGG